MSVVIREARVDELPMIADVLAAAFEEYRPADVLAAAYGSAFERYLEDVVNVRARFEEAETFVAASGSRIVGTGMLYPPGRGRQYARAVHARAWPDDWATLRLLAVDPGQRCLGIGRKLVDARVERARQLGARVVALHTSRQFAGGQRMARRLGWQRCPEYDYAPAPGISAEAYVLALSV